LDDGGSPISLFPSGAHFTMNLTDFYNQVSRLADTDKTKINVADTKRVLSIAFAELEKMDASELADTLSKGISQAKKKRGK
jgi:hypothetical protein